MTCVLRFVLAALPMLALWAMLAIAPSAHAHDVTLPTHGQALQDSVGEPLDRHDHGGARHDRSCVSLTGHCGTSAVHDVAGASAVHTEALSATLSPDDRAFAGRSPEADTPPPRV